MNYFTSMDPSSVYFSSNWIFLSIPLLIEASIFIKSFRLQLMLKMLISMLKKEISETLTQIYTPSYYYPFLSLFLLIFILNFNGLFLYIFTPTSHAAINFPLALTFWLTPMIYAWMKSTDLMMTHLVPQGTPYFLIPLMIVIEIISLLIRPLTLTIRLMANMLAGHLSLILLSSLMTHLSIIQFSISLIPLLFLLILEMSSAVIQAYIFSMLLTLYSKEMKE